MPSADKPAYLQNLQILRCIAALMVLLSHLERETASGRAGGLTPVHDATGIVWGGGVDVFFVVSGMKFHSAALFHSAATLERVPIFLGLFLVVRGLPALFVYARTLSFRQRSALAILQSTALPMLVVISCAMALKLLGDPANPLRQAIGGLLSR